MDKTPAEGLPTSAGNHHTRIEGETCDAPEFYMPADVNELNGRLLTDQELAEIGPPEAVKLPLDLIDESPTNPRRGLPEIGELADSIAEFSLLQPITVRRIGERYQVLSGHRRLAAYKLLRDREPHNPAWKAIAAVIRNSDDAQAYLMLISAQVHIANWRPREQAHALEQLAVAGMTLKQIGDRLHRSEGWVSRRLRVFADPTLAPYVFTSKMATSVADELLSVRDLPTRKRMAEAAVKEGWSEDQTKGRVRALRLDRQVSQITKLARELVEALSVVNNEDISIAARRDLMVIYGRLSKLGRGTPTQFPSITAAEKAAHISTNPRRQRKPAKPQRRTKFREA